MASVTAASTRPVLLDALLGIWRWCVTTTRVMWRNKVGFAGFVLVVIITATSFLAPVFFPFESKANAALIYHPPSGDHWLGTDSQGRDVLHQIIVGGRDILLVGYVAALITTFIGVVLGAVAAYLGGAVDTVLTWLSDVFLTVPQFVLLAVLAGFVRLNGSVSVAILIGAFGWPGLMRAIRSQVLSLKQREYIEAARALDLPTSHIIMREIAPTMAGYVATHFVLNVTAAMYASVGLIFLGIVPLSGMNWGVMLNLAWTQGAIYFRDSIWYILSPMIAIVLFQMAMLSMSRSISELFDPRLRET